jgi:hypothetical protein
VLVQQDRMEFRLAAEGNTDELRQWLRAHSERINVPAQGSNMTLLYTAINNAKRTDLASLQAGHSRYLSTVRMLCEEYKADVLAPNGGNYNTALHLAASMGATDIVRYLVETLRTPVDRANVFGERALQMAERGGHSECAAILQRATEPQQQKQQQQQSKQRDSVTSNTLGPVASRPHGSSHNSRFHSITVSDSDDDDHDDDVTDTSNANGVSEADAASRPDDLTGPQRKYSNTYLHSTSPLLQASTRVAPTSKGTIRLPPPQHANPQSTSMILRPLPATQLASHRENDMLGGGSSSNNSDPQPSTPSFKSGKGFYGSQRKNSNVSVGAGAAAREGASAEPLLPQPVRPRKEYDITKSRILANPDLQGFRSAYGDGFKYIQCRDHYEIRGILPYTYRGAVYYTPVIISVYAPASEVSDPNSPLGAAGSQKSGVLMGGDTSSVGGLKEVYCRYRVCLDMQNLNDFAVSRKAEYLDPVSGAIIPAPGDDKYQTLTAYIRNVVVRSFEAVPPLIVSTSSYAFPLRPNISQLGAADNADPYRHHHSHNAPTFMKNALPMRSAAHLRCAAILRDLSKFGDGLGRYFPANHRIVVYVPVFSEHKAAVLALPQERPYTTTVDQYAAPASPGGGANDTRAAGHTSFSSTGGGATNSDNSNSSNVPRKAVTQQVAVEAVAELQVRVWIQFTPITGSGANAAEATVDGCEGGVYAYPPRVYLIDAAAHPPAALTGSSLSRPNTLTGQCFASILRDRDTGELDPERVKLSQESWSANGSVYSILVELQKVLRDALESFAVAYTGRRPASTPVQQANTTADAYGRGNASSDAPTQLHHSPTASPLDTFFTSPTTQTQPYGPGVSSSSCSSSQPGAPAPPNTDSAGRCLYCYQPLQTRALLQPCGHDGMCGLCVQRLQSHCREEVFACPVCRQSVRNVMEVFL